MECVRRFCIAMSFNALQCARRLDLLGPVISQNTVVYNPKPSVVLLRALVLIIPYRNTFLWQNSWHYGGSLVSRLRQKKSRKTWCYHYYFPIVKFFGIARGLYYCLTVRFPNYNQQYASATQAQIL